MAMLEFSVTLERMERRKVRVAATSPEGAMASIRHVLPEGARVLDVTPVGRGDPAEARAALDHLLLRDFMDLAGLKDAPVEAWLRAAALPGKADELNPKLALAGLRVTPGADGPMLWVGSPLSIPLLADWFQSFMAPAFVHPALMALDGATRPRGMTFAGIKARAVGLPLSTAIKDLVHVEK